MSKAYFIIERQFILSILPSAIEGTIIFHEEFGDSFKTKQSSA